MKYIIGIIIWLVLVFFFYTICAVGKDFPKNKT